MKKNIRRNLLRGLAVAMPATWAKPVINSAVLPVHAETSFDFDCMS